MPQNVPKNQHYLPVVYLKQFSIDRTVPRKRRKIWRLNQNGHEPVKTEKECHKPFFYSDTEPEKAEKFFHESEEFFGDVAQRTWQREQARGERDYFGLFIFMISLHIRNPAYRIDLPVSRIDAYKLLDQQAVHHIVFRDEPRVRTDDELRARLHSNWGVRLLCIPDTDPEPLLTSDNPSLLFTLDETKAVHYLLLPLTPRCCAVAFDKDMLSVAGDWLSVKEVEALNVFQVMSMNTALYSCAPFSPEDQKTAPELWAKKPRSNGYIDAEDWNMNVFKNHSSFGFIRPQN